MQVEISKESVRSPPLAESFLRLEPPAILHYARLQPFLDQTNDALVSHPMLHELDHRMSKSSTQFTFLLVIPT